jgi:hypothetical protein
MPERKIEIIHQFPPEEPIVAMVNFRNRILLATSLRVYEYIDGKIKLLEIEIVHNS